MPLIALVTDFGTKDHYAGVLKGVIASLSPRTVVVDISHEVAAHDITSAAFLLWQSWPWFPAETVFLAVVDPGVGRVRRIIAARYASRFVVAPDNGLITFVHREFPPQAVHSVENRRYFVGEPSHTFHGRDILAPVAAHLANGVPPRELGPAVDQVELLPIPHQAEATRDGIRGRVLHVDRFGTMVTNIRANQVIEWGRGARAVLVRVNGNEWGSVRATYADVQVGEPLALIGGSGLLEIAINQGRAVDRLGPAGSAVVDLIRYPA